MSCDFVTADSLLLMTLSVDGQIVYTVFGPLNLSLHCLRTWFGEKLLLRKASVFCEILNSFIPLTSAMFLFSFSLLKTGMSERSVSSAMDLSPHQGLRVVKLCSQIVCTSQSSGVRHTFEVTPCVEEFKVTPCVEEFKVTPSLGPRPSHPLLQRKIGKTRGGGGSGQVGTEKFVFRGISEA